MTLGPGQGQHPEIASWLCGMALPLGEPEARTRYSSEVAVKYLMMFPLGSDPEQIVAVELDEPEQGGLVRAGREDKAVETAGQTFEKALDPVRRGAEGLLRMLSDLSEQPSECAIEFGISLNGEAQVFAITKLGAEAYFKVTLNWRRGEKEH
jgi:hypothetical protein